MLDDAWAALLGRTDFSPQSLTYFNVAILDSTTEAGYPLRANREMGGMMIDGHDFDEMVDACRKAHEAVMEHGTAEMQAFTTALLHALAKEAAK